MPRTRPGITLAEFLRAAGGRPFRPSTVVRALLSIRFFLGSRFGWDGEPNPTIAETFASRLTPADLSETLTPAGTRVRLFRTVYRFQKRGASRGNQPHRPRRGVERSGRHGKCLPPLFRSLRAQRRPFDAGLHGSYRSVPQVDRLSVASAQRSHDVERSLSACRLVSKRRCALSETDSTR